MKDKEKILTPKEIIMTIDSFANSNISDSDRVIKVGQWSGGGDSGWVDIDNFPYAEELSNYCNQLLGYGSWAGEWESVGQVFYNTKTKTFDLVGNKTYDCYYEDLKKDQEPIQVLSIEYRFVMDEDRTEEIPEELDISLSSGEYGSIYFDTWEDCVDQDNIKKLIQDALEVDEFSYVSDTFPVDENGLVKITFDIYEKGNENVNHTATLIDFVKYMINN